MAGRVRTFGKVPVWLVTLTALCAMVLAGCATVAAPQGAPPASHPAKKLTPIHVDLNWVSNVEFSGIWWSMKKGWFKSAGIKLNGLCSSKAGPNAACVRPYDFSNTPESENDLCVRAGKALCIGVDDSSAVPLARQAGENNVAIWSGSQKTPFGFMTCFVPKKPKVNKKCKSNTHKNITSPKQWRGLKIGYQQDELYVPEIMLGSVGLNLSDVKPVKVTFDTSDLTTGATDAHLVFINNEPITLKLQGVKTNVIPAYKYGMKAFYADAMFVRQSQISKYKGVLKKFVSAVDRGWKYAMHHPKSTANLVVHKYFPTSEGGGPGALKQQQIEINQFAKTLSRDSKGRINGRMTLGRWKTIIHDLKTYPGSIGGGPLLTANIKAKSCFTDQFAPPGAK